MVSKQITIGKKLLWSVGSLLLMAVALGFTSLNSINQLKDGLENCTRKTGVRLILVGQIDGAGSDMLAGQRGLLMYGLAQSPAGIEQAKRLIKDAGSRWETALDKIRPLL